MSVTKNMKTRCRQLAILAKRLKYGSEEQIEALDELCSTASDVGLDFEADPWTIKATNDELADMALAFIESQPLVGS